MVVYGCGIAFALPTLLYVQGEPETEQTVAEGLRITSRHLQGRHRSDDNKGHGTGVAMADMCPCAGQSHRAGDVVTSVQRDGLMVVIQRVIRLEHDMA